LPSAQLSVGPPSPAAAPRTSWTSIGVSFWREDRKEETAISEKKQNEEEKQIQKMVELSFLKQFLAFVHCYQERGVRAMSCKERGQISYAES
jgi:hypothetical protein